ncbi:MAG: hypothetical protein KGI73_00945 [Patescibacteria group bacterium]|nr:hypothetical protein [Patescibacteria group bacterium]
MTKRVFIAGLVASIAMAMVEMMYEGLFGVGFWSAPVFIAATVLRDLQTVAIPVTFSAVPVVVGLMGHMMNSVILGLIFVTLVPLCTGPFRTRVKGIVSGAGYALLVFFLMWFVVLPVVDPVMLHLNPYVFAMAHIVWGVVLGGMVTLRSDPMRT